MTSDVGPRLVRAIHNFKGKNNDELCFKKGDILTVTQALDGGWWEGTLQGNTGWFPSNYVKEHKPQGGDASRATGVQARVLDQSLSSRHRNMVFKDILDTEASHVHELRNLMSTYLQPLEQCGLLSEQDLRQLMGNLPAVLEVHTELLEALEAVREQPSRDQRVGGAFLQIAARMKATQLVYCANHPRAVQLLDKLKETLTSWLEQLSPPGATLLTLTTGLSRPFRRLDKYPALLTELQRHTEESHIDRGDTQRSVFVYKEMAASCSSMRRQKELELEVLAGTVDGCDGEELQCLGELLHVGPVVLLCGEERRDLYLALFSSCLVQLSLANGRFSYQGRLPMASLTVSTSQDPADGCAFDIQGPTVARTTVLCRSAEEATQWKAKLNCCPSAPPAAPSPLRRAVTPIGAPAAPAPTVTVVRPMETPMPQRPLPVVLGPSTEKTAVTESLMSGATQGSGWCLRPHQPLRPRPAAGRAPHRKQRRPGARAGPAEDRAPHVDDMQLLQVIEAYCGSSSRTRHTVNSALMNCPQVIVAEDEKIIVDDNKGMEERSLVDTVYALRDQVKELRNETSQLSRALEEERQARLRLEALLRQHMLLGSCDQPLLITES
ncbi:rho-type guanine nucleotide exchange factor isoform X1 [Amblyomma americanum]